MAAVRRDGAEWQQTFARGKPPGKLEKVGAARGTGTTIIFTPDPEIFRERRSSTPTRSPSGSRSRPTSTGA